MKKTLIILLCISAIHLFADPPSWQPITGTQYSMIMFARIIHNDDYFVLSGSNMVAAFGPGGETDCRALAGWQPYNPEGFWYFNIVANQNGEEISFKIYDSSDDTIYECTQIHIFQNDTTIGSPSEPVLLSVGGSLITGHVTLITITPPNGNITDVLISNGSYSVSPNSNGDYQMPVLPGIYNLTASLAGYNSVINTSVEVISNQITSNVNFSLIDWDQISGTQFSMVIMCEVFLGDEPILFNGENQVGAFGPGGDSDCRGVAVWQQQNLPYWDGHWFMTVVGNVQSEEITIKAYENTSAAVYESIETLIFNNNATLGSPENPHQIFLDISIDQRFNLGAAWNWISLNVHPLNSSIQNVFSPLQNNVYQIKNQTQSATYFAASQSWIGSLFNITDGECYLVYMINPVEDFTISGEPISTFQPILLQTGWNWIAYYPRTIMNISTSMASIAENVNQVKSQNQSANFINPPGSWVGDLQEMSPGSGYKINMFAPDELVYGNSDRMFMTKCREETDDPPLWTVITGTEMNMVLIASITFDGTEFNGSGQNMAGAFGSGGEADCRSIAVWQPANPPYYSNGFWYFTIVGDIEGESIQIKIYDETTDNIYSCLESLTFSSNETFGDPTNPIALTASLTNINQSIFHNTINLNVFPNPVQLSNSGNSALNISFFNTDLLQANNIDIYNIKGQKIISYPALPSNDNLVFWDFNDSTGKKIADGIYLIRFSTDRESICKKVLILK